MQDQAASRRHVRYMPPRRPKAKPSRGTRASSCKSASQQSRWGYMMPSRAIPHVVHYVRSILRVAFKVLAPSFILLVFDGARNPVKVVDEHRHGTDDDNPEKRGRAALQRAAQAKEEADKQNHQKQARSEYERASRKLAAPFVEAVVQMLDNEQEFQDKVRAIFAYDEADMLLAYLAQRFPGVWPVSSDLDLLTRNLRSWVSRVKPNGVVECVHADACVFSDLFETEVANVKGPFKSFDVHNMLGWTTMHVMVGSDYFGNFGKDLGLPGMGPKAASEFVREALLPDVEPSVAYATMMAAVRDRVRAIKVANASKSERKRDKRITDADEDEVMMRFERGMLCFHAPYEYVLEDNATLQDVLEVLLVSCFVGFRAASRPSCWEGARKCT